MMNERNQKRAKPHPVRAPLFASTWMALFLLLRKELAAARSQ